MHKAIKITLVTITFSIAAMCAALLIEDLHSCYLDQQLADRTIDLYVSGAYIKAYDFKTKKEIWIKDPLCVLAKEIKEGG